MPERSSLAQPPVRRIPEPPPLLVRWEPWHHAFFGNLQGVFRSEAPLALSSRPAPYWHDALVTARMRKRPFLLSVSWHAAGILLMCFLPMLMFVIPERVEVLAHEREPLTAPLLSDYLPAVNTGSAPARQARKGHPKYAKQEVISLPPNPDNFEQTIINPPNPNILKQHVDLPNMVIWNKTLGAAPVAAATRQVRELNVPTLDTQVVQPAAENVSRNKLQFPGLPEAAVVAPPSENVSRPVGQLNIAPIETTVENPTVVLPPQRAVNGTGASGTRDVAAPPLSAVTGGGKEGDKGVGQLIVLGLNPTMPKGPIQAPSGSRNGEFAAGPKGTPDAPGTPDIAGGGDGPGGHGSGSGGPGSGNGSGIPGGVYVAAPPPNAPVGPIAGNGNGGGGLIDAPGMGNRPAKPAKDTTTLASLSRPRADIPRDTTTNPANDDAKIEDKVFGGKRYYQMTVNMPNLTSAGGSWIIRFAELKPTINPTGRLQAPAVLSKVDPAYSGEALRMKIQGTVVLYAIIHADGSVGDVRVLQGIDDALDHNAQTALARWHFSPASRNGVAEDVEAVVSIPFRLGSLSY